MKPEVATWFEAGMPVTDIGVPHEVKEFIVTSYGEEYGLDVLVETGTCHGHMIEAVAESFSEIHTIEMFRPLYESALGRLMHLDHVHLYLGDSAIVLEQVVPTLDRATLFFLDAHYSGAGTGRGAVDTPIVRELEILSGSPHPNVIIIDDARLFAGEAFHTEEFVDYPAIEWIAEFVDKNFTVASQVYKEADEFVVVPK